MSNFWKLDEEGSKLLATADKVTRDVIQPLAAKIDEEGRFPDENIDAMRKAGLLALVSAKSVGGHGQSLRAGVVWQNESRAIARQRR